MKKIAYLILISLCSCGTEDEAKPEIKCAIVAEVNFCIDDECWVTTTEGEEIVVSGPRPKKDYTICYRVD